MVIAGMEVARPAFSSTISLPSGIWVLPDFEVARPAVERHLAAAICDLLNEARDAGISALQDGRHSPLGIECASAMSAFSSNDHPRNSSSMRILHEAQIDKLKRRLITDPAHCCRRVAE